MYIYTDVAGRITKESKLAHVYSEVTLAGLKLSLYWALTTVSLLLLILGRLSAALSELRFLSCCTAGALLCCRGCA